MRESFEIVASTGTYPVAIGGDLLEQALAAHPNAIIVIDKVLRDRLPPHLTRIIEVEAVEANKSLEYAPEIVKQLRRHGADRTSHIVAIGGGIIQDITTFAASIFMRGVPWSYMPTTVLSMVDSCIGGKSSINAAGYKNVVGNFHPPQDVFVDVSFIDSLDAEMVVGGLFEAAKITYASGEEGFQRYLADRPGYPLSQDAARRIVAHSLRTKKWFIEIDEFDQKERLLLNYGHTFGHAMEAGSDFAISHGIGVGLGMLVATAYARQQGMLNAAGEKRVAALATHVAAMLGPAASNVLQHPAPLDLGAVMEKFDHDKKHRQNDYRIIVPQADGALQLISVPKDEPTRQSIVRAYTAALGEISWPCRAPQVAALPL